MSKYIDETYPELKPWFEIINCNRFIWGNEKNKAFNVEYFRSFDLEKLIEFYNYDSNLIHYPRKIFKNTVARAIACRDCRICYEETDESNEKLKYYLSIIDENNKILEKSELFQYYGICPNTIDREKQLHAYDAYMQSRINYIYDANNEDKKIRIDYDLHESILQQMSNEMLDKLPESTKYLDYYYLVKPYIDLYDEYLILFNAYGKLFNKFTLDILFDIYIKKPNYSILTYMNDFMNDYDLKILDADYFEKVLKYINKKRFHGYTLDDLLVQNIVIPKEFTGINKNAFSCCSELKSICVPRYINHKCETFVTNSNHVQIIIC